MNELECAIFSASLLCADKGEIITVTIINGDKKHKRQFKRLKKKVRIRFVRRIKQGKQKMKIDKEDCIQYLEKVKRMADDDIQKITMLDDKDLIVFMFYKSKTLTCDFSTFQKI